MTTENNHIDSNGLDSLRSASCDDIRAFFYALINRSAGGQEEPAHADAVVEIQFGADQAPASKAMLDDLTIVFQHTLERSLARGELGPGLDPDVLAKKLTAAFRGVLLMQHEGYGAEEIRRFVDRTLDLLP